MKIEDISPARVRDFVEVSHRLRLRGLTTGGGGGISIVVPESDIVMIKGWQIATEDVTEEKISLVDLDGRQLNNVKPCLETPLHLEVIKARPGTGAVIHAHPSYATAFGNIKSSLSDDLLKNYNMLRKAVFTRYAAPGSLELAKDVGSPFKEEDVMCVFMEDHGVTVTGKDIYDAYYRMDMLEGYAKSFLLTMIFKHLPLALPARG